MSALDPTVTGALIGGGAALIGFGASAWNTRTTLQAGRKAASDQRLWEKRSALYEEVLRTCVDFELGTVSDEELFRSLKRHEPQIVLYALTGVWDAWVDVMAELEPEARHSHAETLHCILALNIALRMELHDEGQRRRSRQLVREWRRSPT